MAIVITDDDARRHLTMKECIEAMRVAFRDYALGEAITKPRVRYRAKTSDPEKLYLCNVHVGAVPSYGMACVRAGSNIIMADSTGAGRKVHANPEPVNWSVIVLYDLATGRYFAKLLSYFRDGNFKIRLDCTN